jgi:hypothetical protein
VNRMAAVIGLLLVVGSVAEAQSTAPQTYTLKAEGAFFDRKMTLTIVRDGARERIERSIGPAVMTSLYDFEAHRVYWIGWSGAGSCSSGRYLSSRAPVSDDPVTGTAENLAALTKGRSRQAAGTGVVAGRAARIEAIVGGKRPKDPDEPWPTRVWLAEDGGYLLKVEGEGAQGKALTLLEVTQLSFGRPSGAPLAPPSSCIATNSEMSDAGDIRSHAEGSAEVKVSATADLGSGTTSATVTQAEGKGAKPGALARIDALTLGAVAQPDAGAEPCGTKLQLTATLTVDGPATVSYKFQPGVGGVRFPSGQDGTLTLDAAGSTTLLVDAIFPRSLKGKARLQAQVKGTKGHDGPLRYSNAVPFEVTCAGK